MSLDDSVGLDGGQPHHPARYKGLSWDEKYHGSFESYTAVSDLHGRYAFNQTEPSLYCCCLHLLPGLLTATSVESEVRRTESSEM